MIADRDLQLTLEAVTSLDTFEDLSREQIAVHIARIISAYQSALRDLDRVTTVLHATKSAMRLDPQTAAHAEAIEQLMASQDR